MQPNIRLVSGEEGPKPLQRLRTDTPGAAHTVQFYENDHFLSAAVADFLAAGITVGQPLVVMATAPYRILEPFVQLGVGSDRVKGALGLGLAISRDLARGMDGELSAESTVGEGTILTLKLPLA